MDTPASIEEAVSETVIRRLETALGDRGLLLSADELTAAEADAAQQGSRLLGVVIHRCYPEHRHAGATFEFESERAAARLAAALAFGAVTARVLAPGELGGSVELLCAIFNLGIGLVDGLCDEDAETGGALLELVQRQDLAQAVEGPRPRGWLRDDAAADARGRSRRSRSRSTSSRRSSRRSTPCIRTTRGCSSAVASARSSAPRSRPSAESVAGAAGRPRASG